MTYRPGDEIEWWDGEADPPRWVPGRIESVRYHIVTDIAGEFMDLPEPMVRSAPRLPLEGM